METDIRLVIFDFDGTLADTHRTIIATVQQTLAHLGLPVASEAAITATIGLPLRDCYRCYVPELGEEGLDACEDVHHRLFRENVRVITPTPFPHVRETLQWLRSRGISTSVASSRTTSSLHMLMQDMGIVPLFDYVLGAEDVTKAKPDPEPVLQTLRVMGIHAHETLVVGDMAVDILMGRGAGARTCGVTYGNGSRLELEEAGADMLIDDMAALMLLLQ